MPYKAYWAANLGSGTGGLKKIDGAALADLDICLVILSTGDVYEYWLDIDSAAAESSPDVIEPTANGGDKRWLLKSINNQDVTSDANVTFGTIGCGEITVVDGSSINLQEAITWTGATTENLIEMPANLADALSIQEDTNKYITFITTTGDEEILFSKHMRLIHTATAADDHALEIDANAANFGDIKALDINYITGTIALGQDEGIILINIDESQATTGADVFALEVLATEGSADIYGLKAGALVGPVHQDSGTFANMDSALVKAVNKLTAFITSDPGGDPGTNNVEMFLANGDTVTIGNAAKFEELEFLLETVASGGGIKPTFEFSTGEGTWTPFTPTDGTDGMRRTGVIAWDDADIPTWAVDNTPEYLIRITRTRGGSLTPPKEDKVQIAAVTEYIWDKNGDVSIRGLTLAGNLVLAANSITGTSVDISNAELQLLSAITANGGALIGAADYAAMMALLSGTATATFDFNSQALTSVGTIGCGAINATGLVTVGTHDGAKHFIVERHSAGAPYAYIQAGSADNDVPVGFIFNPRNAAGTSVNALELTGAGDLDIMLHDAATVGLKLGGTLVTKTAAQINAAPHDFTTLNAIIAAADAAIDLNSQNLTGLGTLATAAGTLTIDETASLSAKANLASPTFSGTVTVPSTNFTVGTQVLTQTNLTDLLDGGDTTLHDHDGIVENTAARHAAVTLNASATTGGLSLSTQEISHRAATNAQTGYATAAHITAIEANTLKVTNATHSGEVTGSGALTIATAAVTLAKMADMATASLLGRNTGGVGVPEVLSKATALSLLNVADGANAYVHPNHSGEVTSAADGDTTIINDAVTYAKMQNVSATDKLLGRVTAGAGDVEEIACTAAGRAILDDAAASNQRTTLELGADVTGFASVNAILAVANAAIDLNSQALTSVGAITCGAITAVGNVIVGSHDGTHTFYVERYSAGVPNAIIQAGSVDNDTGVGISLQPRSIGGGAFAALTIDSAGNVDIPFHNGSTVGLELGGNLLTLTSDGTNTFAADHGAAATDAVVNACYGTGAAPTANTTTIGSLYIKYVA